ncbi:MAG TPA: hypothetical protein VK966_13555 [Longimicrobiales bacterium]|nr:hypothetical protein [Longimicrobiales bacterium]
MDASLDRCTEKYREEALAELRAELVEFSYDGLVDLHEDLTRGGVVRGSWGGCVISYKRGGPGSARRDRLGRARNAFTILWDGGWITDEEVRSAVHLEMVRRVGRLASRAEAMDHPPARKEQR